MNRQPYIIPRGDEKIIFIPEVEKIESKPGALETPFFEDARGTIRRITEVEGTKFNSIFTRKGYMRSGDFHSVPQCDLLMSGKISLTSRHGDKDVTEIIEPGRLVIIEPYVPHLFTFLEDTVMLEWWIGPFDCWYYKPYRKIISDQLNTKRN